VGLAQAMVDFTAAVPGECTPARISRASAQPSWELSALKADVGTPCPPANPLV